MALKEHEREQIEAWAIATYGHLLNTTTPSGILINKDLLLKTVNKLVGCRKYKLRGSRTPLEDILTDKYITEDDIIKNLNSSINLNSGNPEFLPTHPNNRKNKIDVREMPLGLDEFAGYKEEEKKFIQSRLSVYEKDLPNLQDKDRPIVFQTVFYEMLLQQLNIKLLNEPKNFDEITKQMKIINDMILKNQEALNALKKQIENPRNKVQEDNNSDLAEVLSYIGKTEEELIAEAEAELKEEEELLKRKRKRG